MTLRGRFRAISVFKWGSRAGRKKTLSPVVLSLSSELPREDLAVTVVERHRMGVGGGQGTGVVVGMLALSPASSCSAGFLVQEKNACAKQLGSQTVGLRTGFSISTARPWTGCTTSLASIPKSETALRRARPREVLASLHPQPERAPPAPTSHPDVTPGGRGKVSYLPTSHAHPHTHPHILHTLEHNTYCPHTHTQTHLILAKVPTLTSHTCTHLYTFVHTFILTYRKYTHTHAAARVESMLEAEATSLLVQEAKICSVGLKALSPTSDLS